MSWRQIFEPIKKKQLPMLPWLAPKGAPFPRRSFPYPWCFFLGGTVSVLIWGALEGSKDFATWPCFSGSKQAGSGLPFAHLRVEQKGGVQSPATHQHSVAFAHLPKRRCPITGHSPAHNCNSRFSTMSKIPRLQNAVVRTESGAQDFFPTCLPFQPCPISGLCP